MYQLNDGPWTPAEPTIEPNWVANEILKPGTNVFRVFAMDLSGNHSLTSRVSFIYVLTAPLCLNTVGNGKVTGATNSQPIEIGKSVALTATPGTGWILTNWLIQVDGNTILSTNKAVPFVMQSNLCLTATFFDTTKPTLTITAPTAGQRASNELFTVSGKVTDNNPAGTVFYQLNGGAWTSANGWSNWNAAITLAPGTNNLKAFALDAEGNRSTTNSASVIYVLTYCMSEYFYPSPVGSQFIYDGLDWDGSPAQQKVEIKDDNFLLETFGGTTVVTNYYVSVMKVESAYGTYSAGQFYPYDTWQDYFISDNCAFGYMGNDDDGDSTRGNAGFVWTNRMAVGQTLSLTRNVYFNGAYQGQGTAKIQLLDVSTVTVPAGTYPGCLHIRISITIGGQTDVHDEWLAPGLGMVKSDGISGDGALEYWELIHANPPSSSAAPANTVVAAPAPPPPPSLQLVPTPSGYLLILSGQAGANYVIESTEADGHWHWTPIWTGALDGETMTIPVNLTAPSGLYRARQE